MTFERAGAGAVAEAADDARVEDRPRAPEATLADTAAMAVGAWDRAGEPMTTEQQVEQTAHIDAAYGGMDHMGGG